MQFFIYLKINQFCIILFFFLWLWLCFHKPLPLLGTARGIIICPIATAWHWTNYKTTYVFLSVCLSLLLQLHFLLVFDEILHRR